MNDEHSLAGGERELLYKEETETAAGRSGTIQIPETFAIAIPPFEGCRAYELIARLRYRMSNGHLAIGYQLIRPNEVERAAFAEILDTIAAETGYTALYGTAPAAR